MLPKKYKSTKNKDRIREEDAKLIRQEYKRKNRKLKYLGMPSGEMKDILAWKDYLEKCSAVEIEPSHRSKLALNSIKHGLSNQIAILFGDIHDVLIKGKDNYRNKLDLPYDIVFLDFFGTILDNQLKRINAINSLIEKQKGNDFLFFLTFNIRERRYSNHALKQELRKIKQALANFCIFDKAFKSRVEEIINWHEIEDTNEMYRQKLFVPYLIKTKGESQGFKVRTYTPIYYLGHNRSPMIHFRFKLISEHSNAALAISDQGIIEIINLNIKESAKGRIFLRKKQSPKLIQ